MLFGSSAPPPANKVCMVKSFLFSNLLGGKLKEIFEKPFD